MLGTAKRKRRHLMLLSQLTLVRVFCKRQLFFNDHYSVGSRWTRDLVVAGPTEVLQ